MNPQKDLNQNFFCLLLSPNLLKHSCDTMSFIGTRPRLNIAVFPAYIAQNESEENCMYSY